MHALLPSLWYWLSQSLLIKGWQSVTEPSWTKHWPICIHLKLSPSFHTDRLKQPQAASIFTLGDCFRVLWSPGRSKQHLAIALVSERKASSSWKTNRDLFLWAPKTAHLFFPFFFPAKCPQSPDSARLKFTKKSFLGSQEPIAKALFNSPELRVRSTKPLLGTKFLGQETAVLPHSISDQGCTSAMKCKLCIRNQIIWLIWFLVQVTVTEIQSA